MAESPPPKGASRMVRARQTIEERKRLALDRVDRERKRHGTLRVALGSLELDRRTGGSLLAGGLAYRLFLWLLPYGLFVSSLFRLLSDTGGSSAFSTAEDLGMGTEMASTIDKASVATGGNALWLLFIAIVLMLLAARAVLRALRITSALSWGVPVGRSSLRATLAIAIGLLLLSVYHYALGPLYIGGITADLVATSIAALGITAFTWWGFANLPHPEGIEWWYFLPGAALTGFGIEVLRLVTDFYLASRLDRVDDLYGGVGVGAAFMAVLYVGARLVVAALTLNAATWRSVTGDRPHDEPSGREPSN
jgi:uncharacterized BrkB/YihY/UPF0761 family membrane protein